MKLTRASSYALHAVVHLALDDSNKPVASHHIAAAQGIPEGFLLKVLKPLVAARVLDSIKGPHGGYKLRKQPRDISMLDVVEAVDGPIQGQNSFAEKGNVALNTRLDDICRTSAATIREHLEKVRVSDLMTSKKENRRSKPAKSKTGRGST